MCIFRKRSIFIAALLLAFAKASLFAFDIPFVERIEWNDAKLIPSSSFAYEALETLAKENGKLTLVNQAPLSVRDFKLALNEISTEALSASGIELYNTLVDYLHSSYYGFGSDVLSIGINAEANLGLMLPASDNNALFTAPPENPKEQEPYNFHTWDYEEKWQKQNALLSVPIFFAAGNSFAIESAWDQIKQNYWAVNLGKNPTNLPFGSDLNYIDFSWPKNATASLALPFGKKSTALLQVGKKGLTLGTPGDFFKSVILSESFDTDFYASLSIASPDIRYQMDVLQIETDKYLYLHHADVRLFNIFSFGLVEGTLVNNPFELRFLNPLMIMHSFSAATSYGLDSDDPHVYALGTTARVSQYFGARFELVPVKNLRIYGLFAQNEIQLGSELKSKTGKRVPNGIAFQGGFSAAKAGAAGGYWKFGAESLYTSPYCYLRYEPETSFVSTKSSHASEYDTPVYTWIGSSYGPDSASARVYFGYEVFGKWKVQGFYHFLAHGENEALDLFKWIIPSGANRAGAYTYYPSSWYGEEEYYRFKDYDECVSVARNMGLFGFVLNAYHKEGDFLHYPLISLNTRFTLF